MLQSLLYAGSGVNHLVHPEFYLQIMPDHYAHPGMLVRWSGIAEILGGVGLFVPATRRIAAGGICLMLVGFLDVHVWMLEHRQRFPQLPLVLLWARLPLQAVLIAWAARYLRRVPKREAHIPENVRAAR